MTKSIDKFSKSEGNGPLVAKRQNKKCNRTRQKNRRGSYKAKSNDSPKIPDRVKKLDIPGLH